MADVLVSHPHAANFACGVALALARGGRLAAFFTGVAAREDGWGGALARRLGKTRPVVMNRVMAGMPAGRLRSLPHVELGRAPRGPGDQPNGRGDQAVRRHLRRPRRGGRAVALADGDEAGLRVRGRGAAHVRARGAPRSGARLGPPAAALPHDRGAVERRDASLARCRRRRAPIRTVAQAPAQGRGAAAGDEGGRRVRVHRTFAGGAGSRGPCRRRPVRISRRRIFTARAPAQRALHGPRRRIP